MSSRLQTRESPAFERRNRWRIGTRPRSIRRPSAAIIAGSIVSDPIIATATTMIVPTANDVNVRDPAKNIPAIAMITVRPLTMIARPEVAAAVRSASSSLAPAARSSRSRRR